MAPAPTPARVLRRVPATAVLTILGVVAVLTVVAAVLTQWVAVVVGLVLLQLGTAVTVLGPWGRRVTTGPTPRATAPSSSAVGPTATAADLRDLAKRVDALGARLLAGTERTRVELMDAVADLDGRPALRRPTSDSDR